MAENVSGDSGQVKLAAATTPPASALEVENNTQNTYEDAPVRAEVALFSGPADAMGHVLWLMMNSKAHKHMTIADMEWLVAPAIQHGQFMILKRGEVPIAYASWAFLTDDAEQRRLSGNRRMSAADWALGDRAWLVDLVAPFGGAGAVLQSVKQKFFEDRLLFIEREKSEGVGLEAVEVPGGENI